MFHTHLALAIMATLLVVVPFGWWFWSLEDEYRRVLEEKATKMVALSERKKRIPGMATITKYIFNAKKPYRDISKKIINENLHPLRYYRRSAGVYIP